jgi:hypothetical protein
LLTDRCTACQTSEPTWAGQCRCGGAGHAGTRELLHSSVRTYDMGLTLHACSWRDVIRLIGGLKVGLSTSMPLYLAGWVWEGHSLGACIRAIRPVLECGPCSGGEWQMERSVRCKQGWAVRLCPAVSQCVAFWELGHRPAGFCTKVFSRVLPLCRVGAGLVLLVNVMTLVEPCATTALPSH